MPPHTKSLERSSIMYLYYNVWHLSLDFFFNLKKKKAKLRLLLTSYSLTSVLICAWLWQVLLICRHAISPGIFMCVLTGSSPDSPWPAQHGHQPGGPPEEDHEQRTDIPSSNRGRCASSRVPGCPGLAGAYALLGDVVSGILHIQQAASHGASYKEVFSKSGILGIKEGFSEYLLIRKQGFSEYLVIRKQGFSEYIMLECKTSQKYLVWGTRLLKNM